MILTKLLSTVKSFIEGVWERHWAIHNLEHVLNSYDNFLSDDVRNGGCPIMTLREVDGLLSLVDVLSFVNAAKGKGLRSALLTVPLSKTDPGRALFGKMLKVTMDEVQVATERLPDSPIRLFGWSFGASVWRLSW